VRWEELLGTQRTARLSFWQRDEQYGIRFGADELVLGRDDMTRLLLGTTEGEETSLMQGRGELTEVLETILPLPGLWYGLNYV
jgi:hypothetical protein